MKIEELMESLVVWKPIDGWSNYEVSNTGQVRSTKTNKVLAQEEHYGHDKKSPYMRVHLSQNGVKKHLRVNRLVAYAFIGPPPDRNMHVDHKDNNTRNNKSTNLQWLTPTENLKKRLAHKSEH
jgi:hypothetical protein